MTTKIGDAVLADARKAIKERKQQQRKLFSEHYDQTRIFKFPRRINMDKFFFCPKMFGHNGLGQVMKKHEIAVYPVLCSKADFEINNWFQMPQQAIARMAGLSANTAREAVNDLAEKEFDETPLIELFKTSVRERHFYIYRANFIRQGEIGDYKGQYFKFYTCLIDSGVWAELKPRAKCLYMALRNHAIPDIETYYEIEGFEYCGGDYADEEDHENYYRERKWDLCLVPMAELCRYVNIEPSNNKHVIEQLEQHHLIEKIDRFVKVYFKPTIKRQDHIKSGV